MCYSKLLFWGSFKSRFTKQLDLMPLSQQERDIIINRYVHLVILAEAKNRWSGVFYYLLTNIVTISGVLITAFLSLDKFTDGSSYTYWVCWSLAIILTIANKMMYAFNINRSYLLSVVVLEKLYSEGWSFVSGIGKYNIENITDRFRMFCSRIEKIKIKTLKNMHSEGDGREIISAGSAQSQTSATRESSVELSEIVVDPPDNIV